MANLIKASNSSSKASAFSRDWQSLSLKTSSTTHAVFVAVAIAIAVAVSVSICDAVYAVAVCITSEGVAETFFTLGGFKTLFNC